MFATHFVSERKFSTECSLPCSQPTSSRRGRFISPVQSSIITLEKVSKTTMNK